MSVLRASPKPKPFPMGIRNCTKFHNSRCLRRRRGLEEEPTCESRRESSFFHPPAKQRNPTKHSSKPTIEKLPVKVLQKIPICHVVGLQLLWPHTLVETGKSSREVKISNTKLSRKTQNSLRLICFESSLLLTVTIRSTIGHATTG